MPQDEQKKPGGTDTDGRSRRGRLAIIAVAAAGAAVVGWLLLWPAPGVRSVALYKTPWCGCCDLYVEYLRENGFEVQTHDMEDLTPVKRDFGIRPELHSCHTTIVDGYAVEGHVPVEAIERLLAEKPGIRGIALPGMPSGSPGMPGPKTENFVIYTIADGPPAVFMEM